MRISDWSSDVCSSDLAFARQNCLCGRAVKDNPGMPAMLPSYLNGQRQGRSEARGGRYGLEHGECLPRFGKFARREASGVDLLRFPLVPECSLHQLLVVSSDDTSSDSRTSRQYAPK